MDAQTALTMRCSACGTLAQVGCSCGAVYQPSERAASYVRDNPMASARTVMEKTGAGYGTAHRAKAENNTAGDPNGSPEGKTRGKDGKLYPARKKRREPGQPRKPKAAGVKQAQRSIDIHPEVWKLAKVRARAGKVSVAHMIGELLTKALDPNVEVQTLSKTAQDKLTAAMRQHQRKLDGEFEQRVVDEVMRRNEKAFPLLQQEKNKAHEREKTYREFLQQQKKIFTADEYKTVIRCLHPDSNPSDKIKNEAFRLFNLKKFALTGEK